MDRMIFVNLPIRDMARSQAFFRNLGFGFDPQFTNEQGACMVIREDAIYAMLLLEPFFQTFTKKQVADARQSAQVLICLSCSSREEVDALMAKALQAGATEPSGLGGTGLGLSIVKHITLAHGGRVADGGRPAGGWKRNTKLLLEHIFFKIEN